jgi:hypothetical protein
VVAFSLYDNPAGMGFSVVPGTHKALFPQPRSLGGMDAANSYDNSIVAQPGFKAGDALMFTEACRHGIPPPLPLRHDVPACSAADISLESLTVRFGRRHHALGGAAVGAPRPADEVLPALYGLLGHADEFCRDRRRTRRAAEHPAVRAARFSYRRYSLGRNLSVCSPEPNCAGRKMIMTKAGIGLGQQDWETEKPTMQWRPHLGPLLFFFSIFCVFRIMLASSTPVL